jgi:putative ABC transport system permease protein
MRGAHRTLAQAAYVLTRVNARHLFARRRRTLLTVVSVAAAVTLVVAIQAINTTVRAAITSQQQGLAGDANVEIVAESPTGLSPRTLSRIRATAGVGTTIGVVSAVTDVRAAGHSERVLVYGVPPRFDSLFEGRLGAAGSQLQALQRSGGALVSGALLTALGAHPAGRLGVRTSDGESTLPISARLAPVPFASLNGGKFVIVSLATAQRTLVRAGAVNLVYILASPGTSVRRLRQRLVARFGGIAVVGPPAVGAAGYQTTFDSIASIAEQTGYVALFVAVLAVLNSMLMTVAERRRELAAMLGTGTPQVAVALALLGEAALVGLVGGILGTGAGLVLANALTGRVVASYGFLPLTAAGGLSVGTGQLLRAVVCGPCVAIVGAALPAIRLLRTPVAQALRFDVAYEPSGELSSRLRRIVGVVGGVGAAVCLAMLALGRSDSGATSGLATVGLLLGSVMLLPTLLDRLVAAPLWASRKISSVAVKLAAGALDRNRVRTAITVGASAVTVAMALGVGTGLGSYESTVKQAASDWYEAPLYVNSAGVGAFTADQPLPPAVEHVLLGVRGVETVYGMRYALLVARNQLFELFAFPLQAATNAGNQLTSTPDAGQAALTRGVSGNGLFISRLTARRYRVGVGGGLELPTAVGRQRFTVGGVFKDISPFNSAFIDRATYERLFHDGGADRIAVIPAPGTKPAVLRGRLNALIARLGLPATVLDSHQMAAYVVATIQPVFSLAKAMQVVSLLIAGLIVAATMLTATFERRRELAIERAIGMTRSAVVRVTVIEAAGIALLGAIVAVPLGALVGLMALGPVDNQLAWQVPLQLPFRLVVYWVGAGTAVTVLAAFYPSRGRAPGLPDRIGIAGLDRKTAVTAVESPGHPRSQERREIWTPATSFG